MSTAQRRVHADYRSLLEALRAALRHRSLRAVSRETGISPSSIRALVAGVTEPYPKTVWKLRAWHVRQARAGNEAAAAAAPAAVALLVELLPAPAQSAARERLLGTLREVCGNAGRALPETVAAAFVADASAAE